MGLLFSVAIARLDCTSIKAKIMLKKSPVFFICIASFLVNFNFKPKFRKNICFFPNVYNYMNLFKIIFQPKWRDFDKKRYYK
jgi:hypothetical protein